jgi:hypothetical protein
MKSAEPDKNFVLSQVLILAQNNSSVLKKNRNVSCNNPFYPLQTSFLKFKLEESLNILRITVLALLNRY